MSTATTETTTIEEKEIQMYGMTKAEMIADYETWNIPNDARMMQMRAMGILSDIQESMSLWGEGVSQEGVRQALNRAKYFMSEVKLQLPR